MLGLNSIIGAFELTTLKVHGYNVAIVRGQIIRYLVRGWSIRVDGGNLISLNVDAPIWICLVIFLMTMIRSLSKINSL